MNRNYTYRRPVRRSLYSRFRHRLRIVAVVLIIAFIGGFVVWHNIHESQKEPKPVSSVKTVIVGDGEQTYNNPYFKFKDTGQGKWVLDKHGSNATTFMYDKYNGNELLSQIIFYINSSHDMRTGATRVLPVRIINNNSFQVTGVSDLCVNQYGPNEPHITKEIEDENVLMYCDAGDDQYVVIVGEIGGDFHLNLKRSDGTPMQVEIVYTYNGPDPGQSSLINVVDSFQAN